MIVCSKCGEKHMRSECDKDSEVTRRNEREHDRIWNAAIDAAVRILEAEHKIEPQHIPFRITTALNKIRKLKK